MKFIFKRNKWLNTNVTDRLHIFPATSKGSLLPILEIIEFLAS